MNYKAEIKEIPEQIVYFKEYFVKGINEFFREMAETNFLQELCDKVVLENPEIRVTDPEYNLLLFLDGEYKERDVRLEFCDAVTAFGRDGEDYRFKRMPGFQAVSVMHKGPNEKLGEAYSFACQWMEENGYKQAGCPRNSAIDGFWNRDNEEDYLTEIQIPVERA